MNIQKTRILFQGDSITDAGRARECDDHLGNGYPAFVAGNLGVDYPGKYSILNRGVSGDRVVDLYARWKIDCINLVPDVLSILIGVNDVWHEVDLENGVEAPKFERVLTMLLEETSEKLPDTKLILLEPFVLKGCATVDHWEIFQSEVALRAEAVKRVAHAFGATFVPLQEKFNKACSEEAPESYWLADGVHPTAAGHTLIACEWLTAFKTLEL